MACSSIIGYELFLNILFNILIWLIICHINTFIIVVLYSSINRSLDHLSTPVTKHLWFLKTNNGRHRARVPLKVEMLQFWGNKVDTLFSQLLFCSILLFFLPQSANKSQMVRQWCVFLTQPMISGWKTINQQTSLQTRLSDPVHVLFQKPCFIPKLPREQVA